MAQTCCCRQPWQLRIKKNHQPLFFFDFVYKRALETLVFSFVTIEMESTTLVRAFWQPSSSLTLWAGPRIINKRRVYGLPRVMYVAIFHCTFCKTLVRAIRVHNILAHTVGGIKTVTFPFRSVPFRLNGNRYCFRAVENGERRSMKRELNGNGTVLH